MTRKRFLRLLYTFATITILFSCSDSEGPDIDNSIDTAIIYEELDVSYGSDPLQDYDVFLPANRTESSTHVILLVHGGGWIGGDKEDVDGLYDLLKVKMPNYAIVSMNYRLTTKPDNPFLDQLEDVSNVLRELDIQSSRYNISDSYALVGVSAGGHMSLQHSYTQNDDGKIKAVGNIVGPTYFLDEAYANADDPSLQLIAAAVVQITGVPISNSAFYESISPYNAVTANSPPTIQFFGDQDPLVPLSQATLLAEQLDQNNVPNELTIYAGEGHGWADLNNWDDTFQKFKVFVEKYIEE